MSTNIVFSWNCRNSTELPHSNEILTVSIVFTENSEEKIFQQLLEQNMGMGKDFVSGRVEFVAKSDFLHKSCISRTVANPSIKLFYDLDLTIGQDTTYYKRLAKDKNLDELELELVELNDRLGMVLNEADYLKEKETLYHTQTEELSSDTVWWPVTQMVLLIMAALIQILAIRRFFKAHKVL